MRRIGALYKNDLLVGTFERAKTVSPAEKIGHHLAIPSTDCIGADINITEMGTVMCVANRWAPLWQERNIIFLNR